MSTSQASCLVFSAAQPLLTIDDLVVSEKNAKGQAVQLDMEVMICQVSAGFIEVLGLC
jgi:hypothetical protein